MSPSLHHPEPFGYRLERQRHLSLSRCSVSPLIRHDTYPAAGRRGKNNKEHLDSLGRPLAIMCVSVFRDLVPIGVVGGFPDADIAVPSPGYSLISALSAVLTIFHFFHLYYCCLDRLCPFVGYQHLIFPAWPALSTPVYDACGQSSTSYFNLLQFHL